jgi:hypothetical protein
VAPEQKGPRGFQMTDPPEQAEPTRESLPPMTFGAFVLMLSTSARVHLGEAVVPGGDEAVEPDLELAHQTIDILEMLEEKTRGNLDSDEEHLIQSVLHDLRMRYVEVRDKRSG